MVKPVFCIVDTGSYSLHLLGTECLLVLKYLHLSCLSQNSIITQGLLLTIFCEYLTRSELVYTVGLRIKVEDASTQVCQTKEVVFHTMRGRSRG